ncbi:hypothetical protein [Micromonospora sp. NPDC005710]|uniref:hypothetical protein n=1 Tax=Micromonospora sp. NPDC005710 TaxID=3157051 RepID=UPI0033DA553F
MVHPRAPAPTSGTGFHRNGVAADAAHARGARMGDAGVLVVERFDAAWHRGDLTASTMA